ncbi:hypothetical protein [Actinoalloteichus hymeniacidonis]|uniref:hypothetical protein n=1 Tax=Actinoalloteichus hymeniacidonis TaxID=340345 RepID=UPI0012FA2D19|nr:hypothetical protein [Actinoalloteichus hymeniacidonis]MBB5906753.1 hypothetical protein [Actinoalloteichus hymeniacidonis]
MRVVAIVPLGFDDAGHGGIADNALQMQDCPQSQGHGGMQRHRRWGSGPHGCLPWV